jgi:hypothetical protein
LSSSALAGNDIKKTSIPIKIYLAIIVIIPYNI